MNVDDHFDFEQFEKLKYDQWQAARNFLLQRYPVGSDAKSAVNYVTAGGAKCVFANDRGEAMYYCTYTRPGRGFMALVSSIEWKVIILTDSGGIKIKNIGVGRDIVGP